MKNVVIENNEEALDPSLLLHERWDVSGRFVPFQRTAVASAVEMAEALLRPAGRFRSPLSSFEKWKLRLAARVWSFDPFSLQGRFFEASSSPVPYEWQVLLNYLHRQGILANPWPTFEKYPHDQVKDFTVQFSAVDPRFAQEKSENFCYGNGSSDEPEEALSKAVGELLERYFLRKFDKKELETFSVSELKRQGKNFFNPFEAAGFSDGQKSQFPERQFDERSRFKWVKGRELRSGKEAFITAQHALWRYSVKGDPKICQPTTNGGGGHFTYEKAVLSGLYEAVQRDGFLIFWLNSLTPDVIDVDAIDDGSLQSLLGEVRRYRNEVFFLNITTDLGIPACACVLVDRTESGPRIAVGGGCGFDVPAMLIQSLREALSVNRMPYKETVSLANSYTPFTEQEISRERRLALWKNRKMFKNIEFFLSGKRKNAQELFGNSQTWISERQELEYVLDIFRNRGKGYEVYAYEPNDRVLETIGYHVVMVAVPQLVPLYLNEDMPTLGARRLKEVPLLLSRQPAEAWNQWPHPFP